jgi:LacI family transcriptional regulator
MILSVMKGSTKPRVTVRDIAEATGLHHTTVSLGLRNSPKLRAETLQKIMAAAERLGYIRDPMLSALNAYRQSKRPPHYQATIAWINNWPKREELLQVSTFRLYYEGACDRARQLGYAIEEIWLQQEGMSPERVLGILKARNILGLLMAPQPHSRMEPPLDYSNFSAVAFGYSMQPPELNVVTSHHFHSMNMVFSNLLELGYRRIGLFVWEDWDEKVENAWLGGLQLAYWKNPELVRIPTSGEGKGDSLEKWLSKYKPDVVVSYDSMAQEIKALGYDIPGDIGFVSLSKDPTDDLISGINENSFYTGQKAMDILVDLLHRGERGVPPIPTRLLIESTWVPGTTIMNRNAAVPPKKRRQASAK